MFFFVQSHVAVDQRSSLMVNVDSVRLVNTGMLQRRICVCHALRTLPLHRLGQLQYQTVICVSVQGVVTDSVKNTNLVDCFSLLLVS